MTLKEYMKMHGLYNEEELRLHFRDNLLNNRLPVSLYSCPHCTEIVESPRDLQKHKCQDPVDILFRVLSKVKNLIGGDAHKWETNAYLEAKDLVDRYRNEVGVIKLLKEKT